MFLLRRCECCGDLCTRRIDGVYLCDRLECEAAQLDLPEAASG